MRWSKTILSLVIVYSLWGVMMMGIGQAMKEEPKLAEVAGEDPEDYYSQREVENYMYALENSMEEAGINQFQMGEYDKSDAITVHHVWHSERSLGGMKEKIEHENPYNAIFDPDWWAKIGGDIKRFFTGEEKYGKWMDAHRDNMSYGEPVYIYPHFSVYLEEDDPQLVPGGGLIPAPGVNIQRFVIVRAWDVTGDTWLTNAWPWEVWIGGTANIVAELETNNDMPKHDLYYCIDFVVTDTDIEDYFSIQDWAKRGQAKVVERYGGVIYGDEHIETPTNMQPHSINPTRGSSLDTFFSIIGNIGIAWNSFGGYGWVTLLLRAVCVTPLLILPIYIGYTELKSILPFVGQSG